MEAEFGMSDTSEKRKWCFICSSGSFVIVEEEEIRNGRISPIKWNHLENSFSLQSWLFEDRRSWKQCRWDVPPMTVCSRSRRRDSLCLDCSVCQVKNAHNLGRSVHFTSSTEFSSGIYFCDVFGFHGRPRRMDCGTLQELPGNLRSLGLRGLQRGGAA